MATVDASAVTRITGFEEPFNVNTQAQIVGSGPGILEDTDNYISGSQCLGRLSDLDTDFGLMYDDSAIASLAGQHVGLWIMHVNAATLVSAPYVRIATTTANYDDHAIPAAEFPDTGGWVKIWVEVSRTPDRTGGSGLTETDPNFIGWLCTMGDTSQAQGANMWLDAIDYTSTGLALTGTSGVWSDFTTADENSANRYGVVTSVNGVIYCKARLTLGNASSLAFTDSDFTIVFPNQGLVAATFMGVTVDLQNASTSIAWTRGTLAAPGTKKGDLIVTGTSGAFTASGCSFNGLRVVTLTSKPVLSGCAFNGCGLITAPGTSMQDSAISGHTGTGLLWDANVNTDGKLDGSSFTMGTANHGIELGTNVPASITLRDVDFFGYGADDTTSAAIYNNSGKSVTINIVGGSTPTIRNGSGASTNLVTGTVTVQAFAVDNTGAPVNDAQIYLAASGTTMSPFPVNDVVTISNSGTTATVTHTGHGLATNDKVRIFGASHAANNGVFTITVTGTNTYTYTMGSAPGSDPTGTITSTFVFLKGGTGAGSNTLSMSRAMPSNQVVTGWCRKSSSAPYYKEGLLAGTVTTASGASLTGVMIED